MKFVLAEKQTMTQKFTDDGVVIPVTKLLVGPCVVTQIKKQKPDGYFAIQISTGSKRKLSKPLKGHFKNLGNFRYTQEFRLTNDADIKALENLKVGDQFGADLFVAGDRVKATGNSKGRGFQGGVKRHGFHGQKASHGHKDQQRMPGSIGAGGVQHVLKGMRMAGQMGNCQVTVTNLEVVEIDPQNNWLYIKGAVPGATNGLITLVGDGQLVIKEKTEEKVAEQLAPVDQVNDIKNETEDIKKEELVEQVATEVANSDELKAEDVKPVEAPKEINQKPE